MRYLIMVIAFICCVSCANTVDTFSEESLDGDYRVTGINGKKVSREELVFSFSPVGNRVSGITGCNNFSANYSQDGRNLEFSTPMNTRKYCEGKMETERQILSSIEKATRLEFDGNEVVIYSEEGQPLITLTKMN